MNHHKFTASTPQGGTEAPLVNGKSVVGQIVSKFDKTEVPEAKQSMILESLCTGKNLCVSSFRNHNLLTIKQIQEAMVSESKTLDANISVSGYKPVALVAASFVVAYAAIKFADKLCGASVVINADNRKVEG